MSRSPEKVVDRKSAQDYINAYHTLNRLHASGHSFSGHERNCVFLNTAGAQFADVSATSGLDFVDDGRGVASVDWDHDGDLDLWISNRTAPLIRFARNDTPSDHHYLVLRLEGTTCNRDAIGARVEVVTRDPKSPANEQRSSTNPSSQTHHSPLASRHPLLIQTLHAGHGFLSQSSKWLHFGLGKEQHIDHVLIRWPGGNVEIIQGLKTDQHYWIVQGSGRAVPWSRPSGPIEMTPSTLLAGGASSVDRIPLAAPLAIPILEYKDFSEQTVNLNKQIRGVTLLNFWASWCHPCLTELRELTQEEAQLRDAGLTMLALNVDGLGENSSTDDPIDPQLVLDELHFPFHGGLANSEMLDKLQILHDFLFHRKIPLGVPTSYLIDGDGRLAIIYRGTVSIDRLLEDVRELQRRAGQEHELAGPFPGRWALPRTRDFENLALRFAKHELFEDAILYQREAVGQRPNDTTAHVRLAEYLRRLGETDRALESAQQAVALDPTNPHAHTTLGILLAAENKLSEAIKHYQESLRVEPDSASTHLHLGEALLSQRLVDKAVGHFQHALRSQPNIVRAHVLLGGILQAKGKLKEATVHFQQVVNLDSDHALGQYSLGSALSGQGHFEQALKYLRAASRLKPEWSVPLNDTAWILATCPQPELQDGAEAVRLAERAVQLTEGQNFEMLDTLAVAYAAAGQFDKAVEVASDTMALATDAGEQQLAKKFASRLKLFEQSRPYHPNPSD